MSSRELRASKFAGVALLAASIGIATANAQSEPNNENSGPVRHIAQQQNAVQLPQREFASAAVPGEHPLMPALRWAQSGLASMRQVEDYSCTFVKHERIDGVLNEPEYAFLKVRHDPFSVYMYFLEPAKVKGREAIYIDGRNNGKIWAHTNGIKRKIIGTVSLDPNGRFAMEGNRYPMTEVGFLNLTERLLEVGENDTKYGECEAKIFPGATINKRPCTCIQAVHPTPRREFRYHIVRIYVDDELNIPVRYESHWWPQKPGGDPVLLEAYTYLNIKMNNGFTDADFDPENPDYNFP